MSGPNETSEGGDKLAEVLSFADEARQRGRPIDTGDIHGDHPAVTDGGRARAASLVAAGAMRRRLHQLSRADGAEAVDDKLAKLVFDSADDESTRWQASVRTVDSAVSATRQLTFEGPDLLLEVQVDGRNRELTCQVVPPQPAALEIRHSRGSIDLGQDQFGTFYAPEVPAGAVSLRCVALLTGGATTATSWVTL